MPKTVRRCKTMDKQQVIKLLTYLSNCYNNKFKFPKADQQANQMKIEVWHDLLKYYDNELVTAAAKKKILNDSSWPPSVGEIVHQVELITQSPEDRISAGMAWNMVLKAVRKYGYYKPKEAMQSLPPKVREAVEHFGGFNAVCHSKENDSYAKTHFHKLYKEVIRHNKDMQYLPEKFKEELLLISEKHTEGKY
jgi:hypothetical protein